jgi:thiamine kinase-like enzyme
MHEEITIPELTEVVSRVTALLGPRQGSVVQLEGGITNRNFRVNFGGTDYVVRLPGKRTEILGIDRTAECIANKAASKLGMAPGVAAMFEEPSCLVTMFVAGREMTAEELREPETLAEVARDLRRFHDSGTELPTEFDSFRLVEEYAEKGRANGSEPPEGYDDALGIAHRIEEAVRGQEDHEPVPAHNDLLTANFLRDGGEAIQLIDWEYAGMGDRWFDLGNFAANNELADEQEDSLLEAYFGEPPD